MVCKTSFSFKKAIAVNEKMLREIEEQLLEFYSVIHYSVTLENRDDIIFDSLDELISFENSKINRICKIHIRGNNKSYTNEIQIYMGIDPILGKKYGNTVRVDIETDDISRKTILKGNLENIFIRNEESKCYNFIATNDLLTISQVCGIVIICIFIFQFLSNGFEAKNKVLLFSTFISCFVIWGSVAFEKIRKEYFPQVIFLLGDGIEDYKRKKSARGNFFWSFIVAVCIAFISFLAGIIVELN